jgi:hypothetical protein
MAAVGLILFFFLYSLGSLYRNVLSVRNLKSQRNELTRLKMELQDAYFNQRTIPRKEYYELLEKYNNQLEEVEVNLSSLTTDLKRTTPYQVKGFFGKRSQSVKGKVKDVFRHFKKSPITPLQGKQPFSFKIGDKVPKQKTAKPVKTKKSQK